MTDERESRHEHEQRCAQMRGVIQAVRADMVSCALADLAREPDGEWCDRIYSRLEAMTSRDLALLVVVLMHESVAVEAKRLWSALHTMTPKDVR